MFFGKKSENISVFGHLFYDSTFVYANKGTMFFKSSNK